MKNYQNIVLLVVFLFLLSALSYGQRGIGTNTPNPSAILELKSTTKGFLMPRLTYLGLSEIQSPAEGLMVYCTDLMSPIVWNGEEWVLFLSKIEGVKSIILHENLVYSELISSVTGRTWLDRNLGATKVAESLDDEAAYGFYYQWGHKNAGWISDDPNTNSLAWNTGTESNPNKTSDDPCPEGYRVPTIEEWNDEYPDIYSTYSPQD